MIDEVGYVVDCSRLPCLLLVAQPEGRKLFEPDDPCGARLFDGHQSLSRGTQCGWTTLVPLLHTGGVKDLPQIEERYEVEEDYRRWKGCYILQEHLDTR